MLPDNLNYGREITKAIVRKCTLNENRNLRKKKVRNMKGHVNYKAKFFWR